MTQPILSQDLLRTMFDYRDDGHLIRRESTSARAQAGAVAGYVCPRGYRYIKIGGANYLAHRLIFLWHHGWLPNGDVDHKDLDKRNCRVENLRPATRGQNMHNLGISRHNTSGVKGVSWSKHAKKWRAQCHVNGKQHAVGYFDTVADAGTAVRQFRKEHHKEFANHGD